MQGRGVAASTAGSMPGDLRTRHSSDFGWQATLGKSLSLSSPQFPHLLNEDAPVAKGPRCSGPGNCMRLQEPSHSLHLDLG